MLGTNAESTRPYVRAAKALRTKHEIDKLHDLLCAKVSEFEFDVSLLGSRTEESIEYDVHDLRDAFNGPPGGHEPMHVDHPKDYEVYLREYLPKAALKSPTPDESQSSAFFQKVIVLIRKIKRNDEFNRPNHYERRMHLWVFVIARVFPPTNLRCARLTHDHSEKWWDIAAAFRDLNEGWLETIRNMDYTRQGRSDYWAQTYDLLRRLRDLAEEEIRFTVDLALSNEHMPRLPAELKQLIFETTMLAEAVPLEIQL
ncbi:hypothetical protein HII31_08887 [Pseudocercospora fuligena]|uniref:Uncharacterized protein n=1 Tax=Pseudocercospora fuligena TaxID=685502 RepID=A0A8H6RDC5_9PEZI|nr:hypothetical protein HII31_08887 [Pseudocercospora fuligena]